MTLLKDNNYKDINVALLSLEADIKNKITGFDTSAIDKQLAEINSRIDKINTGGGGNNSSDEIEDINSKLNSNSIKIRNIEQNVEDIGTQINGIEQKLSDIFSAENKVTDFNTTTNSGVYYWLDDAANKPGTDYGVLLVNKYDDGNGESNSSIWINQVAYGTNNKIYFRQNINSSNWTEWKAVAFTTDTQLTLNGDNGISSGYGNAPLTIGFPSGTNDGKSLCFDRNSMQARTNDTASILYLNYYGGDVQIGTGNVTGSKLIIQGTCVSSNSYTDANPKLEFKNNDNSQNISLTFTDFDAVQAPASLTLNGNQGNEYFIAPCIKANNKMRIPIGAPSSLEDGCIWIER